MPTHEQAGRRVTTVEPAPPDAAWHARDGYPGQARLEPPPVGAHVVARERIVRRLQGARATRVLLVTAPPGYGKTTALAQWADADHRAFAWLQLSEYDDEPSRLTRSIAFALDRKGAVDAGIFAALRADAPALPLLGAAVRGWGEPFVLVLDDAHVLRSPGIRDVLECIADSLPEHGVLVLAGRTQPALRRARLRAAGVLDVVEAGELALTRTESLALLGNAVPGITADRAEAIAASCEGWGAALYLASIALRHEPDAASLGADLVLGEYLEEEVLSRVADADRGFLMRTALFETLTGPLCDAALERDDSGARLLRLAQDNVLVHPSDHHGERFRVHPLFAETLQAALQREHPAEISGIHRRGARWFGEQGEDDAAIAHALAGRDPDWAAAYVWRIMVAWLGSGRSRDLQWVVGAFDAQARAAHPELDAVWAWAATTGMDVEGARRHVERVDAATDRTLSDGSPLSGVAAVLQAAIATDGAAAMGDRARLAAKTLPRGNPHLLMAAWLEGSASLLAGDLSGALEQLEPVELIAADYLPPVQALCLAQLGLIHAERDDWRTAAQLLRRARSIQRVHLIEGYPTQQLVFAASALVAAQAGDLATARRESRVARDLMVRQRDFAPWMLAQGSLVLVQTALLLGDAAAARSSLRHAETHLARAGDNPKLRAELCRLRPQVHDRTVGVMGPESLTAAEVRVLDYLPSHYSFPQIADQIGVSANTVKSQVHAVYRKLNVASRAEAVATATELRLLGGRRERV